ncbi:MAG: carbon-nitrogen hydrolase family protein [Pseudomonadota bacterium]
MKVALIQLCASRDHDENVETVCDYLEQAGKAGARYAQTPEMTTLIERDRKRLSAQVTAERVADAQSRFSAIAAKHAMTVHIGSMAVPLSDGRFGNRAHLFGPNGAMVAHYDKIHMFDVDLDNGESWRESAIYAPGDRCVVARATEGGPQIGLGICYDLRFASLFRAQAQTGADLITAPAAFTRQTGQAHWHVLLRSRAIETGSFMLAAAQAGTHADGRETYGHSLVIDPWGTVLAEKTDDQPGLLIAEVGLEAVAAARSKIPALQHDRAFSIDAVDARPAQAVA